MPKKLRKDSFFGLHFDFHAQEGTVVGEVMEPDVIAALLDATRPDYVQIDTKGHPGLSSYPTKCGIPAPLMKGDPVRMWRSLTAERGIALYGHHSGLYDMACAQRHPEWAVKNADGVTSPYYMSVFGDYCDEFLIPQLTELALDYGLDGAWVDGECWATQPDYSEPARRAWAAVADGEPPRPGEDGYADFLAFCRRGFEAYVSHYVERMKEIAPGFQVTSNWIYSSFVPKEPTADVAFLSGDYTPTNSVHSARYEGRFLAPQGKPWDLMAWGHSSPGMWTTQNRHTKETVQYCQEAAYVMSLGGGFQFYNIQYGGGGTVQRAAIPVWAETARFVREREPFCKGTHLLPQIGILASERAHDADTATLYSNNTPDLISAKGLIAAAQDAGYSSEILLSHNVRGRELAPFGMLAIGRALCIEDDVRERVLAYVREGGSLLLASPEAAALFADVTGVRFAEPTVRDLHLQSGNWLAPFTCPVSDFLGSPEAAAVYYRDNFLHNGPYPAAVRTAYGHGQILSLCFDLGSIYDTNRSSAMTDFIQAHFGSLFPHPIATVSGSSYAELTVTEDKDRILVHILNHGGPHENASVRAYSELPHPGPITISLNLPSTPKRITVQPEGRVWEGDPTAVILDRLEIHTILEIVL